MKRKPSQYTDPDPRIRDHVRHTEAVAPCLALQWASMCPPHSLLPQWLCSEQLASVTPKPRTVDGHKLETG